MNTLFNKFLTTPLLITLMTLAGCSNYEYRDTSIARHYRDPSSEKHIPIELVDLMSFKISKEQDPKQNFIKRLKLNIDLSKLEVIYKANDLLPFDTAYRIIPVLTDKSYQLQIHYSQAALTDKDAFDELQSFLKIFSTRRYRSEQSLIELFYNAKNNHLAALHTLAKMRMEVFLPTSYAVHFDGDFSNRNISELDNWQLIKDQFAQMEKKEKTLIKEKEDIRRLAMNKLDIEIEDKQLRSLIAKNDRKGVAELLRAYLPWEAMAPFEESFWRTQLDIIENPLPLAQRVLVLRGIDTDMIQVSYEAGKKLSKEEAIEAQKIFIMSSLLTKNQGSWNRRLRSLSAMNEKFIGIDETHNTSEYSRAARITNMFNKHSVNPEGSPFLSFTPSYEVAKNFGETRMSAFLIDPRAIHLNYASEFMNEFEFLLPLMTFPDELALVVDFELNEEAKNITLNKRGQYIAEVLKKSVLEKLTHIYGKDQAKQQYDQLIKNSLDYFKIIEKESIDQKMGINFDNMNRPVLGDINLQQMLAPNKDGGCLSLIKSFY